MVQDPNQDAPWATVIMQSGTPFVIAHGNLPNNEEVTLRGPNLFDLSLALNYLSETQEHEKTYSHKDGLPPCPGALEDAWTDYGCKYCGSRYHCGQCGRGSSMMGHYAGPNMSMSCQTDET